MIPNKTAMTKNTIVVRVRNSSHSVPKAGLAMSDARLESNILMSWAYRRFEAEDSDASGRYAGC
jgi:hypothetical protein